MPDRQSLGRTIAMVMHGKTLERIQAARTRDNDVATTRAAIALAEGPVVLVGYSYGGAVVTEAGTHPKVASLVYIRAFAPGKGESVESLIKNPPPRASVPPILPPQDG